ncbi:hypothetical protein SY83_00495 [Paenibacillus swuensis]|uniref:HTH araC/xylS-type domain-containing protein n=1 Tax=Paenibacillus swuensis TaxID=1178515 RepID=A0A172TDH6_9BACL|nr:AraC family transcriptional regulator [Paenibacillus swuensis]ANE45089.1 hypothetical protein SY83_00495 [Paenibacillus swuensis]
MSTMNSINTQLHTGLTTFYRHIHFLKEPFPFTLTYREADTLPEQAHAHDFFQICYVLKGSCHHYINNMEVMLYKGDFFSIPPHMTHRLKKVNGQEIWIAQIDFLPSFLQEELIHTDQLEKIIDFAYLHPLLNSAEHVLPRLHLRLESQQQVERTINRIREELEQQQPMFQLAVRAEMLRLLIIAGREFNEVLSGRENRNLFQSKKQALIKAIEYMENHFTEEIHLAEVAAIAYMSPAYFSSIFKVITGHPFTFYINSLRVKCAQGLLLQTEMKITEVYSRSGFNNASHFIDVFKKHTGVTPSAYRKQA